MATVRWSVGAKDDLREVVRYIARDSPRYAAITADRITSRVRLLRRHPELGRMVPEYGDESIRELIVGDYRVVYRLRGSAVGVAAVVHGARDLMRKLGSDASGIP